MSKNSIKNVLKNADTQKVFELLESKIGKAKTLTIQHNIIKELGSEHKITIALDDFTKERVDLGKRDFVKFIEIFLNEFNDNGPSTDSVFKPSSDTKSLFPSLLP